MIAVAVADFNWNVYRDTAQFNTKQAQGNKGEEVGSATKHLQ